MQAIIFRLTSEPVVEALPCVDVFCPVAVRIECVGPCHRVVFASPAIAYDTGESDKRVLNVCAKLMLTSEALHALAQAIPQYLAGSPTASARAEGLAHVN